MAEASTVAGPGPVGEAARLRLFVALELPAAVRASLGSWAAVVAAREPALRPVAEASLHVTLCFLGFQPPTEADAIAQACTDVAGWRAASLTVDGPMWLPRRSPRVLAVGLSDEGDRLAAVQARLSEALTAGGWYVPERRAFLAHVTVGRVRRGARVRAVELPGPERLELVANRVTLFRSRLERAGARYEALATVHLAT